MTALSARALRAHRPFRRILVAVDAVAEDFAAMEAAAVLAARLQADILALIVEDVDLMRLAQHPQVHAFGMLSQGGRRLAAEQLRTVLKLRQSRTRQALEEVTARLQVKCAVQVRCGRLLTEALRDADADDLVIVGWPKAGDTPSWTVTRIPPLAVAHALAEASARSVLLIHPDSRPGRAVLVAFDGSNEAQAAVAAAALIADRDGGRIDIALLSRRRDEAAAWGEAIASALSGSGLMLRFVDLPHGGLGEVCGLARQDDAGLVVIGADRALAEGAAGRRALEGLACSVLLVR